WLVLLGLGVFLGAPSVQAGANDRIESSISRGRMAQGWEAGNRDGRAVGRILANPKASKVDRWSAMIRIGTVNHYRSQYMKYAIGFDEGYQAGLSEAPVARQSPRTPTNGLTVEIRGK
ncbi:MAG TPA: hypothetical protein PLH57_06580, partial [Oligoflexia bacterium]|nr:hypothetical protein [Oligoflexia bacterium]